MKRPMKCGECGERAMGPITISHYSTELQHDGRTYPVEIQDFEILKCTECGDESFSGEACKRLSDGWRKAVGLLMPDEISQKRKALGLTQKQLAEQLKVSESTISRWESGAQIQQRSMDLFLLLFFDVPAAREYLGSTVKSSEPILGVNEFAS